MRSMSARKPSREFSKVRAGQCSKRWCRVSNVTEVNRESRYSKFLRKKNATCRMDGKREQASIREARGSLIDPFTECCQIAIERAVIERTQFDSHSAGIRQHHTSKLEEGGQSKPGRMSIGSRKILITDPHRQIRQRNFTDGHHLIFAVIQFIHGSLLGIEIFQCS